MRAAAFSTYPWLSAPGRGGAPSASNLMSSSSFASVISEVQAFASTATDWRFGGRQRPAIAPHNDSTAAAAIAAAKPVSTPAAGEAEDDTAATSSATPNIAPR